jgi:glycosyltransferase involved in cell wall biosynthesis
VNDIRVAHLVDPTFGSVFRGPTHYLFSLLSGWKDENITLDLYGTKIKPLNINSGERDYCLPEDALWSNPKRQDRWGRIRWSFDLVRMLISRRHDYDIVQFHTLNWGGLLSPLFLHPFGKKVVYRFSLFGNDNPSYIYQQPRGRLQIALMRRFDGFIGLCDAQVDDAIKHGFLNVIRLPNFLAIPQLEASIDEAKFEEIRKTNRKKFGLPLHAQVLLFVGGIIHRKGLDTLIDTFIELSQNYPSLYLVLVGPQSKAEKTSIDETFVDGLKNKIQTANLKGRVIWAGLIKKQSLLVEFYRTADIFVFPTRNEGSPNVLPEAMAAGLPIVASLLPGITDGVVSEGANGFLVEQGNVEEFVLAIDRLLRDSPMRIAMGAAGRKIVLEKFSFSSYCQHLREFYMDLYWKSDCE